MPFRDVIGHARQIALLASAARRGSLPPALLFAGPPGVGKWRIAQALAQAVNCPSPVDGDACGTCRSCDRIARGLHVDVVVLEPDDTGIIKVDAVREALKGCGFRPFEGLRRVVAVRDADALNEQAQNAFLKSLEEPPDGTMFVLTSAAPDALLRTVRSRLMRLAFGRLTTEELVQVLVRDHGRPPRRHAGRRCSPTAASSAALAPRLGRPGRVAVARRAAARPRRPPPISAPRLGIARDVIGKPELTRLELAAVLRVASSLTRDLAVVHAGADRGTPRQRRRRRRGRAAGRPSCRRPPRVAPSPPSTAAWRRSSATPGRSSWQIG